MKFYTKTLFALLLTSHTLFADCEVIEDDKFKAHELYQKTISLYYSKQYAKAYKELLKSFKVYPNDVEEIVIDYKCKNLIPGPYAPIIKISQKHETKRFRRLSLGKSIKRQLSPTPYLFVQYQNNKTIVSLLNTQRTSRANIPERLPLENFTVKVGNTQLNFGQVPVNRLLTRTINKKSSLNTPIQTHEDFGFQLYK